MARTYLETWAASLAIKEMQIQPALRFHFIKKTQGSLEGGGERGMLIPCWWEQKLAPPLWKTVMA